MGLLQCFKNKEFFKDISLKISDLLNPLNPKENKRKTTIGYSTAKLQKTKGEKC